ncbi:glycosyltransferase [Patescibacteria group bacterium]|nr:glycosyltransferase family 2 protein [Candidatus Falkowbacteria bacterium]MBU3905840.1 glycosyltransferase [Patescibacteria group bacterium]MBU4015183.1 glycosyltransferase [Patescibacteria group bacterium]MBU4027213.1 glycosyltransferase [Patescibacteria group bacterium]MBU4073392.1 glycosyltransferase [Patescibacteria group bacterium]
MISIIIPVYNQAEKLKQCLESIKNQAYDNYEIIIINDRSTDKLSRIIELSKKEFGYKIEWLHNYRNHGAPYTRNKGFRKSKGEYLLFCDADAELTPNALELMLKTLNENPNTSYAYSSFLWGKKLFKLEQFSAKKLKQMPYIHTMSLIKREDFPGNGWDESTKKLQDWDLWLTMLEQGHVGVWIDKILFKVQTGGTISSWLPSFAYKIFPFLPSVKKYKKAVEVIKKKHRLI